MLKTKKIGNAQDCDDMRKGVLTHYWWKSKFIQIHTSATFILVTNGHIFCPRNSASRNVSWQCNQANEQRYWESYHNMVIMKKRKPLKSPTLGDWITTWCSICVMAAPTAIRKSEISVETWEHAHDVFDFKTKFWNTEYSRILIWLQKMIWKCFVKSSFF